jgi:type IV pilus assembly protein PilB
VGSRVRIGELLVDAGLLSRAQLDRALAEQSAEGVGGRRLGQLIVALGFVTEDQLAKVLSQQLSVPWVSLGHVDFSPSLLSLVHRENAERFCVIPVYVRRERKDLDTLFLAMDDPTQDDVLRMIADESGLNVRPMIAPPSDIREAIERAYGGGAGDGSLAATARRARLPSLGEQAPAVDRRASPQLPTMTPDQPYERPSGPELAGTSEVSQGASSQAEAARPTASPRLPEPEDAPGPADAPRLVPVTLLDGTTLQLPVDRPRSRPRTASASTEQGPSVTESPAPLPLVAEALRASLRRLPPEQRAERLEGLVLSLAATLIRKGLLTERELLEGW